RIAADLDPPDHHRTALPATVGEAGRDVGVGEGPDDGAEATSGVGDSSGGQGWRSRWRWLICSKVLRSLALRLGRPSREALSRSSSRRAASLASAWARRSALASARRRDQRDNQVVWLWA